MAAMQDVRSLVVMLIDSEIANATDPTWEAIERHGHDIVVEAFKRIRQQIGGPCVLPNGHDGECRFR